MRAYLIRRVLLVIPTLFIVTILVFLSVRFIPGNIMDVMAARMGYEGGGVETPGDFRGDGALPEGFS